MQEVHTRSRWACRRPWPARPGCWGSSGAGCGGASGRPCCRSPAPCRRCRRRQPRDRSLGVIEEDGCRPGRRPGQPWKDIRPRAPGANRSRGAPHPPPPATPRPAAYPERPWRAWKNRCATRWAARPRPGLEKAFGLRTTGDLLRHYPRRYARRGELTDLASLRDGEDVTVFAQVAKVTSRPDAGAPRQAARGDGDRRPRPAGAHVLQQGGVLGTPAEPGPPRHVRRAGVHLRRESASSPTPSSSCSARTTRTRRPSTRPS